MNDGPADRSEVEGHLLAALERYPDAFIDVVDASSLDAADPAVVELLPLGGRPVTNTRAILPFVESSSHPVMFGHALRLDGPSAPEEGYVADPIMFVDGRPGIAMLFDLRARLGVFVGVVAPVRDGVVASPSSAALSAIPTKVARYRLDSAGTVVWADESTEALTGDPLAELIGRRSEERFHPDDRGGLVAAYVALVAQPDGVSRVRARRRHAEDRWIWMELTFRNHLCDPDDGTVHVEMLDINNEVALLEDAQRERAFFAELADTLPVGVLQVDEGRRVTFANDELATLTGHVAQGDLEPWLERIIPPSRDDLAAAIDRVLDLGGDEHVEIEVRTGSGERRVCATRVRGVRTQGKVAGALISLLDVTSSVEQREELEWRAQRDPLTGLLNRQAITLALEGQAAEDDPERLGFAMMFIDLDGFKPINDRFGHAAGDDVLVEIAARLGSVVRDGDLVARLGGDEFVVACPHADTPATELAVAERIRERLREPIRRDGVEHRVTASIGVAWAERGADTDLLMGRADAAMYVAKQAGGDQVRGWPVEAARTGGASLSSKRIG